MENEYVCSKCGYPAAINEALNVYLICGCDKLKYVWWTDGYPAEPITLQQYAARRGAARHGKIN